MAGLADLAKLPPETQAALRKLAGIAERYPAFAPFIQVPELAALFVKASDEGWTSDKLATQLHGTRWWQERSSAEREWVAVSLGDPGEAGRRRDVATQSVIAIAGQEGVSLSTAQVAWIAESAAKEGLTVDEIRNSILSLAKPTDDSTGALDATVADLKATGYDYGLKMSDKTYWDWAMKIRQGRSSLDAFTEYARTQAKRAYAGIGDDIDRGMTVRQIGEPYAQMASELLEIDANQVDFTKSQWARALQGRDPSGKIVGPMTYESWRKTLMGDPSYGWDRTTNARQTALGFAQRLGEIFGQAVNF